MVILAIVIFTIIGNKIDWATTANSVKNANLWWIMGAILTMMYAHYLRGWRWNMLSEPTGYILNKRRAFYAVMIGYLVNVATSRGGEFVRCAMAAKSEKAPVPTLIGSVITERLIDLLVLMALSLLCLAIQFQEFFGFFNHYILTPAIKYWYFIAIITILGLAILFLLFRNKKLKNVDNSTDALDSETLIQKFTKGMQSVFRLKHPGVFIMSSFGIWIGYWLSTYCTLKSIAVTTHLTIANALGVVIFSSLGIIIPVPGGAGVWGTVAYGLTLIYGLSESHANTYGIFSVAFSNLLMIVFGSIAYLLMYIEIRKLNKENNVHPG